MENKRKISAAEYDGGAGGGSGGRGGGRKGGQLLM